MFAKEGLYFIIPSIVINIFIIYLFNYLYYDWFPYFGWFFSPTFILTAFFIFFFRDPSRTPDGEGILAPTDGTVMFIKQEKSIVTIFIELAASDIHTQKSPINGKILNVERIKGAHHPIYFIDKGKTDNDYRIPVSKNARINIDMVDDEGMKMRIVQISGAVARRCKAYIKPDDIVNRGQKIGIIMFGSLLLFQLEGKFEIVTKVGNHVNGGKHVLLKKI